MRGLIIILSSLLLLASMSSWRPTSAQEVGERESFIGDEACGQCHQEQHQAWKQSPHGNALAVLSPTQQQDSRCTHCHSFEADKRFSGVQCESCHGPGGYYHLNVVMRDAELARALGLRDVNDSTCRVCHTLEAPALTPFDYQQALSRMGHCVSDGQATEAGAAEPGDETSTGETTPGSDEGETATHGGG